MIVQANWLQRWGLPPKEHNPTLWLIGSTRQAFESIASLLEEITRSHPRLRLILSADTAALRVWLTDRFPDCLVWNLPLGNFMSSSEFLRRGNVRAVVVLEGVHSFNSALIAALRRRAVPLIALCARTHAPKLEAHIERACEVVIKIDDWAKPKAQDDLLPHTTPRLFNEQVADKLGEILTRNLTSRREGSAYMYRFWQSLLDNSNHGALNWRLRRYHDLAELGGVLGHPGTILCLGNGPSSEDETLKGLAHDVLFRVNHRWLKRGVLTRPDVVFVGGKPSMRAVSGVIFGLKNNDAERRLVSVRLFHPFRGATKFFNVADMAPMLASFYGEQLRLTNGASMLAAAVALNPKRLIVAGIDMFQHPDGSYPDNKTTPNSYSPAHNREAELRFLLALFDSYNGELIIVGDVLKREWIHYKNLTNVV